MNTLPFPKTDRLLALSVVALVLFGIVMIYSASVIVGHTIFDDDKFFVKRQLVWAVLGIIGMIIAANIDYRFWKGWAGWMLVITLVLLISVFFFSKGEINGAHRWISLGKQSFQPSELAKLTFIIYISAWLVRRQEYLDNILTTFLPYLLVLIIISGLMLAQPDFGTLMVILAPAIVIYYVAGLNWKQAGIGLLVFLLGISLILISPYRRTRLTTFLYPEKVSIESSYQIKNIAIAIGSGGLWGLGFGESKQKRLFLPEPHTDSIFAVISEELGALRALLVILTFGFILYRGLRVAFAAPDLFGTLLAVGITTWFGFQAFINLGAMLRLVPLVGVPLPFVSYGGTSLVISLFAVGILLNISGQVTKTEPNGRKKAATQRG